MGIVEHIPPNLPESNKRWRWGERKVWSARVEILRIIGLRAQRHADFCLVAGSDALTRILDEEGVMRAAQALHSVASACTTARKDCEGTMP